jgi:hypothetical protein
VSHRPHVLTDRFTIWPNNSASPVCLGKLDEGGTPVQERGRVWGLLIFQDMFKQQP